MKVCEYFKICITVEGIIKLIKQIYIIFTFKLNFQKLLYLPITQIKPNNNSDTENKFLI